MIILIVSLKAVAPILSDLSVRVFSDLFPFCFPSMLYCTLVQGISLKCIEVYINTQHTKDRHYSFLFFGGICMKELLFFDQAISHWLPLVSSVINSNLKARRKKQRSSEMCKCDLWDHGRMSEEDNTTTHTSNHYYL